MYVFRRHLFINDVGRKEKDVSFFPAYIASGERMTFYRC